MTINGLIQTWRTLKSIGHWVLIGTIWAAGATLAISSESNVVGWLGWAAVALWIAWGSLGIYIYIAERYHRAPCGYYKRNIKPGKASTHWIHTVIKVYCEKQWHSTTGHKHRPR